MFVDLGNRHLVQFIHERLHVHHIYDCKLRILPPLQNLIVIGHIHRFEEVWLIGVCWSLTSFPYIGYSCKSKPKMDFSTPCQTHQLGHDVVLCTSWGGEGGNNAHEQLASLSPHIHSLNYNVAKLCQVKLKLHWWCIIDNSLVPSLEQLRRAISPLLRSSRSQGGGYLCTSQYFFPTLFVDVKLLWRIF